jgi:protein-L-isoaspartate O-methyltransferase
MGPPTPLSDRTYDADFAAYYDLITSHKDYGAEGQALVRMIQAKAPCASPRVLDVGCGTGTHAALLAERGALRQARFADVEVRTALPELAEASASDRMLAFTAIQRDGPT